jgi:hypothetical protein
VNQELNCNYCFIFWEIINFCISHKPTSALLSNNMDRSTISLNTLVYLIWFKHASNLKLATACFQPFGGTSTTVNENWKATLISYLTLNYWLNYKSSFGQKQLPLSRASIIKQSFCGKKVSRNSANCCSPEVIQSTIQSFTMPFEAANS